MFGKFVGFIGGFVMVFMMLGFFGSYSWDIGLRLVFLRALQWDWRLWNPFGGSVVRIL